ncbi:hypothetical protein CAPTEDRAFT_212353 [Capitella teleta]|uniref:Uncharacterized protein n=1 Tax=Capitella teleta TaxID=283909 RepID=R7V9J4_CAPTE|nr:hypothetical protein CAPTEDRAFT_212353 [Capitella teleta]|eukprot:ELU12415.1 hypothetical protein CAPTEDRAFT_212353 [Capitella teleta]
MSDKMNRRANPNTHAPRAAKGEEPLPSYESVLAQTRGIKEISPTDINFTKNMCSFMLFGEVGLACTIALSITLPIVHVIIGIAYLDDCPIERFIPIYLVVTGCFLMAKGLLAIAEAYHKKELNTDEQYKRPKMFICCDAPIGCFLFCWYIAGNVWIFSTVNEYQSVDPALPDFCNATLFLYAYWTTLASYICVAALVLFMCCACFYREMSGKNKSRK